MKREETLKWIKLSREINSKFPEVLLCPINGKHSIELQVKDYPKSLKREQTIYCKDCNRKLTFTISLLDLIMK